MKKVLLALVLGVIVAGCATTGSRGMNMGPSKIGPKGGTIETSYSRR